MGDRFGIFGAIIRIRKLSLLLVVKLRMPNTHPLPGAPPLTKASQQSTLGYAHGSSLSADRCASYELDGDARHRQGFYPGSATVWA